MVVFRLNYHLPERKMYEEQKEDGVLESMGLSSPPRGKDLRLAASLPDKSLPESLEFAFNSAADS